MSDNSHDDDNNTFQDSENKLRTHNVSEICEKIQWTHANNYKTQWISF